MQGTTEAARFKEETIEEYWKLYIHYEYQGIPVLHSCASPPGRRSLFCCNLVSKLNLSFLLTFVRLQEDGMICEVFLAIAPSTMLAAMLSVRSSLFCWPVLSCSFSLLHLCMLFSWDCHFFCSNRLGLGPWLRA